MANHGGHRDGAGRKPSPDARRAQVTIKVSDTERAQIRDAAEAAGMPESVWMRQVVMTAVQAYLH